MANLRCSCCHRVESDGAVLVEGGARHPEHPARFAWDVLKERRAAGRCPVCDMPMLGDGPVVPYRIDVGGDALIVGEAVEGPDGPMSPEEAERWMAARLPRRAGSGAGPLAFSTLAIAFASLMAVWFLGGLSVALWFLWIGAQNGVYR